MKCQRCKERESTGVLVHLCDECFNIWEAETRADPNNANVEPIDMACKYQSAGGLVPDHITGIKIWGTYNDPKIDFVKG